MTLPNPIPLINSSALRILITCALGVALCLSANAQEVVWPITLNTSLAGEPNKKMLSARISESEMKSRELLELPFLDDFSVDRFPGNPRGLTPLWTSRNATLNYNMPNDPPTLGVATMDGADALGFPYSWSLGTGFADTLASVPIDLTGDASDGIGISFYFQPQGKAVFPPTANVDSLRLEFYAPELDQWFWIWSTVDISNPTAFTYVYIPIVNVRYLKEGFQFRFRNFASLQGAFDPWHIDYVRVDRNGINASEVVDDVAFVRQEFTLLEGFTAMPLSHYASLGDPLNFMRQDITVRLRNLSGINRTLVGNEIRVLHEGNVVASLPNANSPAITAGNTLDYIHSVGQMPNAFVFPNDLATEKLTYDVEIAHGVADLAATASNDTIRFKQEFHTHYAYDDGSAEWAYAVAGTGSQAAMRFNALMADSIFAVQIFTMPFGFNYQNTPITIFIWEDTGNGPGQVLGEALKTVQYGMESFQEMITYTFESPVPVSAGSFFVGYRQANQAEALRIGLDRNSNANQGNLWFMDLSLVWTASQIQGTTMIRPMFTSPGWEDIVASTSNRRPRPSDSVNIYPNPARDHFTTDLPQGPPALMRVYDLQGRMVLSDRVTGGAPISTRSLPDGMYIVHLETQQGELFAKKLVIRR